MAIVSTGSFTVVDMYDAPALNAWIGASQTTTQTYNNTLASYSPNYASTPQVLTLNLIRAGGSTSLVGTAVTGVKWYKSVGNVVTEITSVTTTDAEYMSGTSRSILNTKANVPTTSNNIKWSVEGIWTDPDTELPVSFRADINLNLVQLAKAALVANTYTPSGVFFRNNLPANLKINCDLYKDGQLSSGSKKFKWFAADTSVSVSQDADGGVGWREIITTTGAVPEVVNIGFDVATTVQGILTITPAAVLNNQTYKVVVIDNEGGLAGTKSTGFATIHDMDDPIMTIVESTGGNILKNGVGSTTLTARVFRNGDEIDGGGTIYTYKWTKWENNVMSPNFGGTGIPFQTGKTLRVESTDVNTKATFRVEVEG